jgi:nitroimidazol reductase NimA-like FMN-containing flavoprotein (pyridoxamine 5'-phosphate oxidase superfamily)
MDSKQAKDLLREVRYCVLASVTSSGQPWVTPLFYNYDESYNLIWESAREAMHSQLLVQDARVAIVVAQFDEKKAVYLDCTAREVEPERLDYALNVFMHGPHKNRSMERRVADYLGDKPLRLYEAVPLAAYAVVEVQTEDGYMIDQRVAIKLT